MQYLVLCLSISFALRSSVFVLFYFSLYRLILVFSLQWYMCLCCSRLFPPLFTRLRFLLPWVVSVIGCRYSLTWRIQGSSFSIPTMDQKMNVRYSYFSGWPTTSRGFGRMPATIGRHPSVQLALTISLWIGLMSPVAKQVWIPLFLFYHICLTVVVLKLGRV